MRAVRKFIGEVFLGIGLVFLAIGAVIAGENIDLLPPDRPYH